jgi:CBS-domain-containing membrane protein
MKTTAQDIMTHEVLSIREGASLEDALKLLINNRITGLPVVNAKNEMVGIVSEYDIMAQIAEMPSIESASLSEPFKFTKGAKAISASTGLKEIVSLFLDLKYRRLPVVEKKKLVGIITRRDVMRLFYYRARLK